MTERDTHRVKQAFFLMASAADVEAVDFEPEDDDLMDEDGGMDTAAADATTSPMAPLPKLKSAITGAASSSAVARKTKGRGFREDHPEAPDRSTRLAASKFDSLKSPDGPGPQRCQFLLLILFDFRFLGL